jgi:hypothetical protein
MPQYVIERDVPGIGTLTPAELRAIARKSNAVLAEMAPRARWRHSYLTGDKLFCVYEAEDAAALLEHAAVGGFPVTAVHELLDVLGPDTAR